MLPEHLTGPNGRFEHLAGLKVFQVKVCWFAGSTLAALLLHL